MTSDDKPIARMIQSRWSSQRPFEGATDQTIQHKLTAGALTVSAQAAARRELSKRGSSIILKPSAQE